MLTFKTYVRQLAAKYGHTQKSIARAMKIDEGQMSRLLDTSPRPATLDALCAAVGCDADERLEVYRLVGKAPPEILDAFRSSPEMARAFRALSQNTQDSGAMNNGDADASPQVGSQPLT